MLRIIINIVRTIILVIICVITWIGILFMAGNLKSQLNDFDDWGNGMFEDIWGK